MTTIDCVTNTLQGLNGADRPRPCLQRVYDEESGRWVPAHYAACDITGCRGCVPRPAVEGTHLCATCLAKARDALSRVENLTVHLRSITKTAQAVGERVDTSMEKSILMPDTWTAADGLLEALGAGPIPSTATIDDSFRIAADAVARWFDFESIVATREGSKRAVVLTKRLQVCLQRWPDSEAEFRPVNYLLCPGECRQQSLYRRAPMEYLDELLCQCATEGCGWWMPWDEFSRIYAPILEGMLIDMERADRAERKRKRQERGRSNVGGS